MESRRRWVAGLTVAAVALIVAGVAAVAIDPGGPGASSPTGRLTPTLSGSVPAVGLSPTAARPTPSGPPEPTSSLASSLTPVSPSAEPHPQGFAAAGSSIVYYAGDGTVVPVQAVPGLRATLVDGSVTYKAVAGNRYGLRVGAYAGEFMPNVAIQQLDGSSAQTGGIVLVGPVAARLIAEALAAIASPADRWIVALPVDIRGTAKPVDVSFDSLGLHGVTDTPRVLVRYSGALPVVNVIPDNAGYHVLVEQVGVSAWQVIDPTRLALPATQLDLEHPMNELIVYGNGAPGTNKDVVVNRRVAIGTQMLTAAGEVSVSLAVRTSHADLSSDQVLKVADVPVFAASS